MADLVVKVRLSAREVRKRFAELPAVLSGTKPDRDGIRSYFFAVLARELMSLIHKAFRDKSMGGSDSLGNSWRGLSPKTVKRRRRPSLIDRFPLSAKLYILRVSDALFRSLAPGRVVGDDYHPPENQIYKLTKSGLALGTELHYAAVQHRKRPIWPEEMLPWISEAIDTALSLTLTRMTRNMSRER